MSPRPTEGYRWLDSLARWSARGRDIAGAPADPGDLSVVKGGTTRRTALRTAAGAGAVALLAPMRLLEPSIAGAATTQLTQCSTDSFKKVRDDFQACIKTPLEYFEVAGEAIADAEENLLKATKPSVRRRLQRIIDRENRTRNRTLKSVEFCNAAFAQDRAEGEAQCQAEYPPAGGGNGGCEAGYLLCGTYCCDTAFATCEGCNGEPICCRIDGNCCG